MEELKVSIPEEKSTEEIIREVLANPVVKEQALTNAKYIQSKLNNWFTIDQLIKKTNFNDIRSAQDILDLLCLFQLAYREEKLKGIIKYKVTISKEDRIKLLKEEIHEAYEHIAYLNRQVEELEKW